MPRALRLRAEKPRRKAKHGGLFDGYSPLIILAGVVVGLVGLAFLGALPEPEGPVEGFARATDGDTLRIIPSQGLEVKAGAKEVHVRLFGIDAPELQQRCRDADGSLWGCGLRSAAALRNLVDKKMVRCEPVVDAGKDPYGRMLAVCNAKGLTGVHDDLARELVREGHATAYAEYSAKYALDETVAKAAHAGIWREGSSFVPPAAWRRGVRLPEEEAEAATTAPRDTSKRAPPAAEATAGSAEEPTDDAGASTEV